MRRALWLLALSTANVRFEKEKKRMRLGFAQRNFPKRRSRGGIVRGSCELAKDT
jgi:hypothetical protein